MFLHLPVAVAGFFLTIQFAVTPIRKEVITSFWMGVTAHWMGQQIPEVLPGEEKMFLVKIKSTQQYQ